MTRIEEDAFTLDLPGDWEGIGSEPGTLTYRELGGLGLLIVQPLNVRPMFAIADKLRLMSDYVDHRAKYETGQAPTLAHGEPLIEEHADTIEARWDAEDALLARRQRHRVLLANDLLVDFCFSAPDTDSEEFDARAAEVLGGAALALPTSGE